MDPAIYIHIDGYEGFDRNIDFNKKAIRKAMRKAGQIVAKEAKSRVSKKQDSTAGGYPGKRSGKLQKSIKYKVSKSGFMVKIQPDKTNDMKDFYPAFLWYGVKRGAKRTKSHKKQMNVSGWRISPRGNYMADSLQSKQSTVKQILRKALAEALEIKK